MRTLAAVMLFLLVGTGFTAIGQEPPKPDKPAEPPQPAEPKKSDNTTTQAAAGAPKLKLSAEAWDFGEIVYGEEIKYQLKLTNEGASDLEIKKLKASCACTVPQKNVKKVLAPGESTEATIKFNSRKKQGKILTIVSIDTNDPASPRQEFRLTGFVRNLIDIEPVTGLMVRSLDAGKPLSRSVKIHNRTEKPLELTVESPGLPDVVDVQIKEIDPGKLFEVVATSKPPVPWGRRTSTVQIKTNVEKMPVLSVPLVVDMQRLADVRPPAIYVNQNNPQSKQASGVRYFGERADFNVTDIICPSDAIRIERLVPVTKPKPAAAPGQTAPPVRVSKEFPLTVHIEKPAQIPPEGIKVVIKTDEPKFEELELVVTTSRETYDNVMEEKTGSSGLAGLAGAKFNNKDLEKLQQVAQEMEQKRARDRARMSNPTTQPANGDPHEHEHEHDPEESESGDTPQEDPD